MRKSINIGTRGSKLAMIQTESVADMLRKANPDIEVNIQRIVTQGDRNRHIALDKVAGQGIFIKELEEALLDCRVDLAVHSLKDLPSQLPDGLCLAAVIEREDPRDVLVSGGKKLAGLPAGARIGTGSQRRAAQVKMLRPDLEVAGIRGNVDTRLNKVTSGEFDGVISAAAALKRLGWEDRISEYLPVENFLPAIGQGALGIETRSDDKEIAEMLAPLDHLPTRRCVTAERAFLLALGGGCQSPIAALGTIEGKTLHLDGMAIEAQGKISIRDTEEGDVTSSEEIGIRLAKKILAEGADIFLSPEGE